MHYHISKINHKTEWGHNTLNIEIRTKKKYFKLRNENIFLIKNRDKNVFNFIFKIKKIGRCLCHCMLCVDSKLYIL